MEDREDQSLHQITPEAAIKPDQSADTHLNPDQIQTVLLVPSDGKHSVSSAAFHFTGSQRFTAI